VTSYVLFAVGKMNSPYRQAQSLFRAPIQLNFAYPTVLVPQDAPHTSSLRLLIFITRIFRNFRDIHQLHFRLSAHHKYYQLRSTHTHSHVSLLFTTSILYFIIQTQPHVPPLSTITSILYFAIRVSERLAALFVALLHHTNHQ
jgi:hypothetical protein